MVGYRTILYPTFFFTLINGKKIKIKIRRAKQRRNKKDRRQIQILKEETNRRRKEEQRGTDRRTQHLPSKYVRKKKKTLKVRIFIIIL